VSYATEQVLLEVELDIRVLLDYFEDLYVWLAMTRHLEKLGFHTLIPSATT